MTGTGPREQLELCQSRVRLDIRERFFPQRLLGTAQAPQGMGTALRLPELQERLDSAARDAQGGIGGVSVQGQGLDWMILEDPFQLRILCDSMIL